MSSNGSDSKAIVTEAIYRATMALDDQKWDDWLSLCADDFNYAIKSFSPEINRDMDLVFDMSKVHFFDYQTKETIV